MNNFKTTIGIEVHAVINSLTKMFSSSKSSHNDQVNTNINEIDLGMPGTLPSANEAVVMKAIQLASALNMQIENNLIFDRKNYFYSDLPKGYQITQQFFPIGKNGFIEIKLQDGSTKKITIERIHIEEDTAKQQIINNKIFIDYNRCGMPLIEIVSNPVIDNQYEATEYLKQLKRILNFLDLSDAKMEDGSMRADINISQQVMGIDKLGQKIEIKNLNSISNVAKAIEFETQRQISLLLSGQIVEQDTRRWDDVAKETIYMRSKQDSVDYHYFTEPNILNINLSNDFINSAIKNKKAMPVEAYNHLKSLNFDEKIIQNILDDAKMYQFISSLTKKIDSYQDILTWFIIELSSFVKMENKNLYDMDNSIINRVIEMINLIQKEEINSKQSKIIIKEIYNTKKSLNDIINEYGFKQIKDEALIESMLKQYINDNKEIVSQYAQRPERVEKALLGLLMKDTKGQANPNVSMKILKKILN